MARSGRCGALLLATVAAWCLLHFVSRCFVGAPPSTRGARQQLARRVSTLTPPDATGGKKEESSEKDIDDAVLRMAMAMADAEDSGVSTDAPESKKEEKSGFDFQLLITAFWTILIIYSFGSTVIAITQGRMQDRTGGDFTFYDFFDNIFAFKEWSWETTLGFNPVELYEGLQKGGASS
eukprot:CAMPEP_0183439022 /NCGR_PEP_ID=MMETSP0370-20130417/77748_1 /TAXON_ID=268820 /ORGANISM="Peridinium aciculiferum, Strain PAER-2" /LENGTH=178 /DNA_ID=CAMNT_0025627371 /DNA_START=73 /DNA_END=609 /DNA_ORIENTATION=-